MNKSLIYICLIFLFSIDCLAQNNEETYRVYAELLGTQKGLFSNKVTVTIDFGQSVSYWKSGDRKIVDENGKDIIFNSMVDAMNYMGERGWKFQQAYVVSDGGNNVYHWLLYKDIHSDENINDGFDTRKEFNQRKALNTPPTYKLTYMKRVPYKVEWEIIKEEEKTGLNSDEIEFITNEWRSKTDDNFIYEVTIKKI